jgi:hypothetical protein
MFDVGVWSPTVRKVTIRIILDYLCFLYSSISPGWHSRCLQIAFKVEIRIALAFPFDLCPHQCSGALLFYFERPDYERTT